MPTIEQARREVQSAFDQIRTWADSDEKRSLWAFERELWTRMLALGRALVVLFLARQVARPRRAEYQHDGAAWRLDGERTGELGTRFGKVSFTRPLGRRRDARRTRAAPPATDADGSSCGRRKCGGVKECGNVRKCGICTQKNRTHLPISTSRLIADAPGRLIIRASQ